MNDASLTVADSRPGFLVGIAECAVHALVSLIALTFVKETQVLAQPAIVLAVLVYSTFFFTILLKSMTAWWQSFLEVSCQFACLSLCFVFVAWVRQLQSKGTYDYFLAVGLFALILAGVIIRLTGRYVRW